MDKIWRGRITYDAYNRSGRSNYCTGPDIALQSCEEESAEEDVVDGLGMEKDSGVRAEVHFEFCNDT